MQFFFLSSEDIYLKLDRSKDHMTYIGSTNMSNGRSKTVWCFHFLLFVVVVVACIFDFIAIDGVGHEEITVYSDTCHLLSIRRPIFVCVSAWAIGTKR